MILDDVWPEIKAEAKLLAESRAFPLWTQGDGWVTAAVDQPNRGILPHHGSWMAGDLPAILWLIAANGSELSQKPDWRAAALMWSRRLESRASVSAFASVSHMFFRGTLLPSSVAQEANLEPLARTAAATIARRFECIGYMKSFGEPADNTYPFTTVDDVINLSVPLWHATATGDDALWNSAISAADTIGDRLVRPDGSCAQVLHFDEANQPSTVGTYQGYSADSCWSRGVAWGIYGFATVYRQTGKAQFLHFADAMADYWIDHVQDDPSPLWDFDLPRSDPRTRDSFAASLAYAGLLELAASVGSARHQFLVDYTQAMMKRLADQQVLGRRRGRGLVGGAALDVPHQHGIDCSVIVGDSYFVEAVWRLASNGRTHIL